jgi:phage terminase Nu1 subunit (DNA packaging protein)
MLESGCPLVSGQLVRLTSRPQTLLTKKQLAAHLGRSERWVELRVRDGMPVEQATDRYGRRRYNLGLVEEWLRAGRPTAPKREDRIALLERRVGELAAQVAELSKAG